MMTTKKLTLAGTSTTVNIGSGDIKTFETGATSHAVNDLILFTDNTRELAELRDNIYSRFNYLDNNYPFTSIPIQDFFIPLFNKAREMYSNELGVSNSQHIKKMSMANRLQYCTLYADDFNKWKQEHKIK